MRLDLAGRGPKQGLEDLGEGTAGVLILCCTASHTHTLALWPLAVKGWLRSSIPASGCSLWPFMPGVIKGFLLPKSVGAALCLV